MNLTGIPEIFFALTLKFVESALRSFTWVRRFSIAFKVIFSVLMLTLIRVRDGIYPKVSGSGFVSTFWVISRNCNFCMLSNYKDLLVVSVNFSDKQSGNITLHGLECSVKPPLIISPYLPSFFITAFSTSFEY